MNRPLKRAWRGADARCVIHLHRIQGNGTFVVNADLIETIEATPDTVVTMVTKRRFVVADPVESVIDRVVAYRASIARRASGDDEHSSARRAAATNDSTPAARAAVAIEHEERAA